MKRQNNKRIKKIRNLILISTLSAIVLTVSTFAWFVGMKTVNVSGFNVEIATTEGLFLSVDGENWRYTLDARNAPAYQNNTNSWAIDGLIPVSTVGDMDPDVSRMMLYEKGSFTTTPGGFRLLTSRVHNYDRTAGVLNQGKGYVVFDLFIKNLSGAEYYPTNNPLNEEAIYLTTNSSVTVADVGGVPGTGIENSVRVAFAQIGRVKADTENVDNITSITCSNVESGQNQVQVTGICRSAQIWEPNDKDHVDNAISWYNTSCVTRKATGTDVTLASSFNVRGEQASACGTVAQGTAKPTYAISRALSIGDNVDVYDGVGYNGYASSTIDYATYAASDQKEIYKLVNFPYFKDSDKILTGTARDTFMTLAPNSITKVRVYIFIEGQDVDNYDFASLGKAITVNFGFTKERYIESDLENYTGPSTEITPTPGEEEPIPATTGE